jgi:hypothetical protein
MVQAVPNVYKLEKNYPNPFNPETTIKFQLPEAQHVTITIYDIAGREIVRLVDEYRQAGSYQTTWKARNVASGVYFYRIQAGHFRDIKRLVLLK